jgi:4-amino-4-deoxy-L-arabinose transferase-like glycosyltransferase
VLFAWTGLFGEHEIVVRLPSLLCGVGSIVLTCALARRIVGPRAALLAGVWLGFAPAHVWYSQEATPYAMVGFLVVAAATLAFRVADVERPAAASLALYLAVLAGAVFTHYFAIVALVPLSVVAAFARPRPRAGLLVAHAVVAAGFGAMLWTKSAAGGLVTGQPFLRPFDAFEAWMLHFHWFLHGNTLWRVSPYGASPEHLAAHPGLLTLQLAAAALVARGLWRALRGGSAVHGATVIGLGMALPALLGALTALGNRQLYIERYAFFGLPFFAVLLAAGATELGGRRFGRVAATALLAAGGVAWGAWYSVDDRWTVYKQNPDWRAVAADLAAQATNERRVLAIGIAPTLPLRYHLRRIGAAGRVFVTDDEVELVRQLATRRGARRVYVVENLFWPGDLYGRLAAVAAADPRLHRTDVRDHLGVRLFGFERRGSRRARVTAEGD